MVLCTSPVVTKWSFRLQELEGSVHAASALGMVNGHTPVIKRLVRFHQLMSTVR
jgi:hypothetical protein